MAMLRAPFRSGAAHIVKLRTVGVEQSLHQRMPQVAGGAAEFVRWPVSHDGLPRPARLRCARSGGCRVRRNRRPAIVKNCYEFAVVLILFFVRVSKILRRRATA